MSMTSRASAGPSGIETHAWGLLSTALTEVLSKTDWLKLWDHVFSNSPPFLLFLLLSYFIYFKSQIMSAETIQQMDGIMRRCNPLDLNKVCQFDKCIVLQHFLNAQHTNGIGPGCLKSVVYAMCDAAVNANAPLSLPGMHGSL